MDGEEYIHLQVKYCPKELGIINNACKSFSIVFQCHQEYNIMIHVRRGSKQQFAPPRYRPDYCIHLIRRYTKNK